MQTIESIQAELACHYKAMPTPPLQLRPIVRDITPEAMIQRLTTSIPLLALCADEGRQILDGRAVRSIALLNGLRDGSPQYVDRKGSGSQYVAFSRLSSNISTQPDSAVEFFNKNNGTARGSGHMARVFVAWPTSTQGYRFIESTALMTWTAMEPFDQRVKELLQQTLAMHKSPVTKLPVLRLSPEAAFRWTNFANAVEADQQPGFQLCKIRDAASKAAENVARLAAVIHVFSNAQGDISLRTIESAIAMVNWYLTQFARIFAPPQVPQVMLDAHALDYWLRTSVVAMGMGITHRKNYLLQRGPIRNKFQFDAALQVLINGGQVQVCQDAKKTWWVNCIANSMAVQLPQSR